MKNIRQLKFPPYEYIKSLPRKSGDDDMFCDYTWTLFSTPIFTYGRLSYNEDDSGWIYFDVMEGGYCDRNCLGMRCKLNKANYAKICKHAQSVYEDFYRELDRDYSWQWEEHDEI